VVQVPSALVTALNGLVVVFVVSSEIWRRRQAKQRQRAEAEDESTMSKEIIGTASPGGKET
jgi:ABC-type uncharacterized transport system permease subunit